jgi:hypothetical protein
MFGWITIRSIKRGVLAFWAAWLGVVTLTNMLDGLKACGLLGPNWTWVSGNFAWIQDTMRPLGVPLAVQAVLFLGVIIWEALATGCFCWAVVSYQNRPLVEERAAIVACGVNLALWCAFQVLDEVFLAFQPEAVHRVIFAGQLLTLMLLHLLPTDDRMQ